MPRKPKNNALMTLDKTSEPNWRGSQSLQRVFETVELSEITGALIESGDQKAIALAERLKDGKFDRANLAKHCAAVQIQPRDVWNILIETRKLSAKLAITEKLVDIVESVASAAVDKEVPCPRCVGTGKILVKEGEEPVNCEVCGGVGRLLSPGSLESQKIALEIGEIFNVRQPMVQLNQQFNNPGKSGSVTSEIPSMSDWCKDTNDAMGGVVEAEIVE